MEHPERLEQPHRSGSACASADRVGSAPVGAGALRRLFGGTLNVNSDLDLAAVLRRVVETAAELVDARYGALGVLDATGTRLAQFITVGIDPDARRRIGHLPKGLGLLGSLIHDAVPLRVADLGEHPDSVGFPANHPPMTSFLGVPIKGRNEQVFGNLYLTEKTTGEVFTDIDEELVTGLASAAAVAIDNARLYEQLRRRESELTAMNDIASTMLSGAEPIDSLRLVARHARQLVDADVATITLPRAGGDLLAFQVVDGPLGEELRREPFARVGSVSGEVLSSGKRVAVDDASADYRSSQPQVRAGVIGPALWVPLWSDGRPFGVLAVGRPVGSAPFSADELALMDSFATQASIILERDRARQDGVRLRILEEEERIAGDLHDTVIQRLFAAGLSLEVAIRMSGDGALRDRLNTVIDDIDASIRQLRAAILGMEGAHLATPVGLRDQVISVAKEAGRALGFAPATSFEGDLDGGLDEDLSHDLLSVLREALSNVARHAKADHVSVHVAVSGGRVVLRVRDDGIGIAGGGEDGTGGRGLQGMRARADRSNGDCRIGPADGGGTVVDWSAELRV